MSDKKIVRVIGSKDYYVEPGDYELDSISTGSFSPDGVELFESGIYLEVPFGDPWFPIWFLEDNNVTFVIL